MFGAFNSSLWSFKTAIAGEIKHYTGSSLPDGFLWCDGSSLLRASYPKLFSVIGTSFGSKDSLSFNLPDFRGQFLRGRMPLSTITGSGTVASNNATFTSHKINRTGFKVFTSSGTLTGLAASTVYYAIVIDDNTLAFATTYANAIAGTKIAISGTNSIVLQQFEDPDAAARLQHTVGGNSSGIGSRQLDEIRLHAHGIVQGGDGAAVGTSLQRTVNNFGNTTSLGTGGNETRPTNVSVDFIIRY